MKAALDLKTTGVSPIRVASREGAAVREKPAMELGLPQTIHLNPPHQSNLATEVGSRSMNQK